MDSLAERAVEDRAEVRSRAGSIRVGSHLTAAAAAAGAAYAIGTWGGPHRAVIVVLFLAATIFGYAPLAFGAERIVESRFREPFFFCWSVVTVALVAALTLLDGGPPSPFALLFFIPIVFAALSYPQSSVVAIGVIDVLAFVAVGVATGSSHPRLAFFAACLALLALLCTWASLDHEGQRAALARVSRADPLTGCLNRRGFEERMEAELDSATRGDRRVGLVVLDLDEFKQVNDTRGHEAGDELLRWIVARADELLRPMDALGRLGGDEFAVLVPGAGRIEAREVADRLRDALGERVSASTGVASFPVDGRDRESLHRRADRHLYAAKHGRAPTTRELAWASALARAVDLRVAMADEHSTAVAYFAEGIAQLLGWSGSGLALLRMAAMLHDVGKVSVPDRILQKAGPLTAEEFRLIKAHASAGAEIVEQVDGLSPIVSWIRHSHEHFDGSGYPDGLSGEEIPEASRIMLVADAFDAMTSDRPYGSALPVDIALDELRANAGAQFDPRCVEALAEHLAATREPVTAAVA